jgi:glycosyltransferase involved in cell wall biosynthesis
MKEYPLVSIIIPMYNSERTLERCLDSVKVKLFKIFKKNGK